MEPWLIELRVEAPFERPHQGSFIVRLQIRDEPPSSSARLSTGRFAGGMDWLTGSEVVWDKEAQEFELEQARSILEKLQNAQIQLGARWPNALVLHPTKYRLTIQSGLNSCQMMWSDELPAEWCALTDSVRSLESLVKNEQRDA